MFRRGAFRNEFLLVIFMYDDQIVQRFHKLNFITGGHPILLWLEVTIFKIVREPEKPIHNTGMVRITSLIKYYIIYMVKVSQS